MVLQKLFSVLPPDKGPVNPESVVSSEAKRINVNGEMVDGWIITLISDEDEVHFVFDTVDEEE